LNGNSNIVEEIVGRTTKVKTAFRKAEATLQFLLVSY